MGAPSEYYTSFLSGNDSTGNGSIGTPWKTVQKALDTITQDTTDGDVINIQVGALNTLSAALDLSTYGAPSETTPLIFRGYTSVARDGGRGDLNGGGSVSVLDVTNNGISFIDMHLHNTSGNIIVQVLQDSRFINCVIEDSTGTGISLSSKALVYNCHFTNITGGNGLVVTNGLVSHCYFEDDVNGPTNAWINPNPGLVVEFCIFDMGTNTLGIDMVSSISVINCTFDGGGGTGQGIKTAADRTGLIILNNIFANFSGVGAVGAALRSGDHLTLYTNNAFFNNTTDAENATGQHLGASNESLASDPFTDSSGDDYTTQDVGAVFGGGLVTAFLRNAASVTALDKGATQRSGILSGGGGSGSGRGKYKYRGLTHSSGLGAS